MAPKQDAPFPPNKKKNKVHQVDSVKLSVLESLPRKLSIVAHGSADTEGWTLPELQERLVSGLPDDGFCEYDLIAQPPTGPMPQVITPLPQPATATRDLSPVLRGVRVHAKTNAVEEGVPETAKK